MEQTFVLKLVHGLDLKAGSARGHVEDVNTGKALRFHSVYELLAFLENAAKERSSLESKERQN